MPGRLLPSKGRRAAEVWTMVWLRRPTRVEREALRVGRDAGLYTVP